jgi:hypothetical protein
VLAGLPDDAVPSRMQRLLDDGRVLHFDLGLERPLYLGFSMGWTRFRIREGPGDWVAALDLADTALNRAKAHGRSTWAGLVAGPRADAANDGGPRGRPVDERVSEGQLKWLVPDEPR